MVMGLAQHGKKFGVYSKSDWNTLECFKPEIDTTNVCLKEIICADT